MTARHLAAVPASAARYAIAVRVSRVGGRAGERFLSPEIQTTAAARAITAVGGVLDTSVGDQGVFYDLDVSGTVAPADRPGLGQALALVREKRLTGVVVYDLSRFSRDTSGGLRALEDIAAAGGHVLSASETIDLDTPAGVFSTTVQLAAHKMRRDEASRGWKATHARRFDLGLPHGKLPLGYVSEAGRAVPDPILGPAVTKAFEEYAAGSVSQKTLAARLGALRGKPMRQGVISQLLRNRFYAGELELLGEVRPGVHPALVDPDTFAAVQHRLVDSRSLGPHNHVPGSPVVGLVVCGLCDRPLYRQGTGTRGGLPRPSRLVCSGKVAGLCEGIGTPLLGQLEPAVRDLALEQARLLNDEAPAIAARQTRAAVTKAQAAALRAEADAIYVQIGRLGASLSKEVMDDLEYRAAVVPLRADLEAVEARLHEVEGAVRQVTRPLAAVQSAAEGLRELWDVMEPLEARAALRAIVPAVRVHRAAYRGQPMIQRLSLADDEE